MSPILQKYWKEICEKEFFGLKPDRNESWMKFYHRQLNSSKSKIEEAGSRLRDSYLGEGESFWCFLLLLFFHVLEKKIHQLKSISAPSTKRPRIPSSSYSGKKMNLMEKSWQEAMNSSSNKNVNRSAIVTFKMKQPPTQKRL